MDANDKWQFLTEFIDNFKDNYEPRDEIELTFKDYCYIRLDKEQIKLIIDALDDKRDDLIHDM
jgi:hypothetical protein